MAGFMPQGFKHGLFQRPDCRIIEQPCLAQARYGRTAFLQQAGGGAAGKAGERRQIEIDRVEIQPRRGRIGRNHPAVGWKQHVRRAQAQKGCAQPPGTFGQRRDIAKIANAERVAGTQAVGLRGHAPKPGVAVQLRRRIAARRSGDDAGRVGEVAQLEMQGMIAGSKGRQGQVRRGLGPRAGMDCAVFGDQLEPQRAAVLGPQGNHRIAPCFQRHDSRQRLRRQRLQAGQCVARLIGRVASQPKIAGNRPPRGGSGWGGLAKGVGMGGVNASQAADLVEGVVGKSHVGEGHGAGIHVVATRAYSIVPYPLFRSPAEIPLMVIWIVRNALALA